MVPLLPFLAVTGGIAAGAKMMGGVVRGVNELVHGRPVSAAFELASAVSAPVTLVYDELDKLGHDVAGLVFGGRHEEPTEEDLAAIVPFVQKRRCRPK